MPSSGACPCVQIRLLEQYSELAAPAEAEAYQACYTKAISNEHREVLDDCAQQVAAMKKALKRVGLFPFQSGALNGQGSRYNDVVR